MTHQHYKYRLALDLGVTSIGAAVIKLDAHNEAEDIIDAGVRIFPLSEGAADKRAKKQARKNNRRTRLRIQLLAAALKEIGLWERDDAGSESYGLNKISPYAIRAKAIHAKIGNPYKIGRALLHLARHRGAGYLDQLVEAQENTVINADTGKVTKKAQSPYDKMYAHLENTHAATVGEYFYKRLFELPKAETKRAVRQREAHIKKGQAVDYAIPRGLVRAEFHKIWDTQQRYYPQMQDPATKAKIESILFYEKAHAPYAIGTCIYIPTETRLPKASILTEKRRIYEAVNNIRILNDLGKRALTLAERDAIIDALESGENMGKKAIKSLLGLDGKHKISLMDNAIIKAYLYARPEMKPLVALSQNDEDALENLILFLAEPINPTDPSGRLYKEEQVVAQIKSMLSAPDLDESIIYKIMATLPKERAPLGKTATEEILQLLITNPGMSHREAADALVHAGDLRFKSEEVLAQEIQGKYQKLPYYGEILSRDTQPIHPWQKARNKTLNAAEKAMGKIANPAVHMMLNQLRLVVNDIIRIYGRPYDINLELTREVGKSKATRDAIVAEQKKNHEKNQDAKKYLKEHNMRITSANILKYKLYTEQKGQDAYNPHNPIPANFNGFEIEHLIPRAKGGTDTYNNLVLVSETDNRAKGDLFPYDYFSSHKTESEKRQILKFARNTLKDKVWRFEPDAEERFCDGDPDAQNRYLTDTSYMAKLAARYLRAILDFIPDPKTNIINTRVLTIKGSHTAKLRSAWYLDGLEYDLMGLAADVPRDIACPPYFLNQETGQTITGTSPPDIDGIWHLKDTIPNPAWMKKPRIDHRHHAIDAITLGCINRNFMQKLRHADKHSYTIRNKDYPLPLSSLDADKPATAKHAFRHKVLHLLQGIHVSHKPDHGIEGPLHEETKKYLLMQDVKKGITLTRYARKLETTIKTEKDIDKILIKDFIKDTWHPDVATDRQRMLALKANLLAARAQAYQHQQNQRQIQEQAGEKTSPIRETQIWQEAINIVRRTGLYTSTTFPTYENSCSGIPIPKHQTYYVAGYNHRVEFYIAPTGKVGWQLVNNFDANTPARMAALKQDYTNNHWQPLWKIHKGDLLEMDTPPEWQATIKNKKVLVVVKKFSKGEIGIALAHDARGTSIPATIPEDKKAATAFYIQGNKCKKTGRCEGKGLLFCTRHHMRKIELTPFGKIKRKHRQLWHGTKKKS
jgi:CRISPR-associated endonuclease Csn1